MTIPTEVVIAFITALLGLLGLLMRAFMSGGLHPNSTVPRQDYDRLLAIVDSYAARFGEQTVAVQSLVSVVEKLIVKVNASRGARGQGK